jgi:hypothetical protein
LLSFTLPISVLTLAVTVYPEVRARRQAPAGAGR